MATYEAPSVQSLGDIMQELQPAVQGQVDVINAQKEANAGVYEAQRAGLDATKTREFNTINTQATGRGMTFSGIPLNEQAEYLSTKYLPGVQASHAQQNADALAYDRESASLNANVFNRAFDWRNQQVLTLNDWNKMLAGQEWQTGEREAGQQWQSGENVLNRTHQTSERVAGQDWQSKENQLGRDFTKSEREASQDFTAKQNAASRAAAAVSYGGGGGGSGGGDTMGRNTINLVESLMSRRGADNHVSPNTWSAALGAWTTGGGDPAMFLEKYSGQINTSHSKDYIK